MRSKEGAENLLAMWVYFGVIRASYQLEYDMDSKTIFARTSKGEDEIRSKTAHLSGDIKRSLLMVDGTATFGEISKRAAPSLRSGLEEMLKELVQGGFVQEVSQSASPTKMSSSRKMFSSPKMSSPSKMVVPPRTAAPHKSAVDDKGENELDFASEFRSQSQAQPTAEAANSNDDAEVAAIKYSTEQAKAKQESENKARANVEAQARAAAEAQARQQAEAKAPSEAEAKAKQEAEAKARAAIEIQARALEAAREKQEAEARARIEAEANARALGEAKIRQEAEARVRAEAAAKAHALAEAKARQEAEARARGEAEAQARAVAAAKAKREADIKASAERELEAARQKAVQQADAALFQPVPELGQDKPMDEDMFKPGSFLPTRTTSATVLFFDVVGYTKQSVNKQIEIKKQFNRLVSNCLKELGEGERIILDTGDGAAIGFMQHPEEALKVAMQFHKKVIANQHNDYPELKARIGIHLGPINVVKDMNGLSNMVGDGINDAQRVMSFADSDQIFISRSYYDFISRLSGEYASLFHYQGSLQDKHGREHPVYKLVDVAVPAAESESFKVSPPAAEVKFEPFNFSIPDTVAPAVAPVVATVAHGGLGLRQDEAALLNDIGNFIQPEAVKPAPAASAPVQSQPRPSAPAPEHAPETTRPKEVARSDVEEQKPSSDEVKKLEMAQAKVWAEAEQRAQQEAKVRAMWDVQPSPEQQAVAKKAIPVVRVKRKPLPWFKLGAGLILVSLIVLFVAPFVMPTREYVSGIEQQLSKKLHQPVYIGSLEWRLLPTPRLDLLDISIGDTKQIKAKLARANFVMLTLFTEIRSIESVELEAVQVNAAALQQVSAWLQQAAADDEYPIARILLSEGKLEGEGFELSSVGGEINFNQDSKFSLAKLHAEGSKYALELEAAPANRTKVSITVNNSALPLLPNWVFDDFTAKGEMIGSELVITELDSRIMGGMLLGNARINWRSGWRAQGSLVAKTITMQNMLKVLNGDLEGTARFQMQAASLARLTDAATLDGSFVIKNGVINGIDIVETSRLHLTENMPGGRTHFDEFSGELSYVKDAYTFRQLKMSAGVLTAKGSLDYSGQQVSGTVTADLALREGTKPASLQLGGTRDNPTLRAVR